MPVLPRFASFYSKMIEKLIGPVTIGSLLKTYRRNNELSLDELSKKLRITKTDLQKIESGKLHPPLKQVLSFTKKLDEPPNIYAKVWCEDEVRRAGLNFNDLMKVI